MSSIPQNMKAYVVRSRSLFWPIQAALSSTYSNPCELVTRPVPSPHGEQLLVKNEIFAANPTDILHADYVGTAGSIIGCDLVGTVIAAGPSATRHKVGDKVFTAVHGGKYKDLGSAAEFSLVDDSLAMSVPNGMSVEEAVTFGVGFMTAGAILYDSQKIAFPPAKVSGQPWYFVSGGATSVGMFVMQLARIAGYRVIASASPRSFDLVKSYGAEHVVSYADHAAALKEIHAVTGGGVSIAVDCVGGKPNVRFAVDAFGKDGGVLTSILPGGKSHRSNVHFKDILLYRYLGKAFTFIPLIAKFPAEPEKRSFFEDLAKRAPEMIETHKIKGNPVEVSKGFDAMPVAWEKLRQKKVSGKKMVIVL